MFYFPHTHTPPGPLHIFSMNSIKSSGNPDLNHCNKHFSHESFVPDIRVASMAPHRHEYLHVFSFCLVAVDTDSAHVTLLTHCASLSDVLCSSSSHRPQTSAEPAKPHLPQLLIKPPSRESFLFLNVP